MERRKIQESYSLMRFSLKLIYATRKEGYLIAVSMLGKPKVLPGTIWAKLHVHQAL